MGRPFAIAVSNDASAKYSTAKVRDGTVRIRLSSKLDPRQRERHISNLSRRAITRAGPP